MGLDTNHLKLTVKQHLDRSLAVLKDPKGFFTSLFAGEISLKEQVIPYFTLFAIVGILVRTVAAIFNYETIVYALHISVVEALRLAITIGLFAFVLTKIEQYTDLKGSFEKYVALLVYSFTASYYAEILHNVHPIFYLIGLYSLYVLYCGVIQLIAPEKKPELVMFVIFIIAAILSGIVSGLVTMPFMPSVKVEIQEDAQKLLKQIEELQQKYSVK